jgi:hypothetical protein
MLRQDTFVRITNQQVYDELKTTQKSIADLSDKVDKNNALVMSEIKTNKAKIKSLENSRKGFVAFVVSLILLIVSKLTFWK